MAGIHYLSIPSIDKCNLPRTTIDKCYNAYCRYGKYKIYEILNNDLCSTQYKYDDREKYKKINLIKRYLYLYRVAMAQTMSFAYNTDEFELTDQNVFDEGENKENCPKCGLKMKVLPKIATSTYHPYSYYDDITIENNKSITFDLLPINNTIDITFNEFTLRLRHDDYEDHVFMKYSIYEDGSDTQNDSILKLCNEDSTITIYACYASNAVKPGSNELLDTSIIKSVGKTYTIKVSDFVENKIIKPTKNGYDFYYWTLKDNNKEIPDRLTEEVLSDLAYKYKNEDYVIDIVEVFKSSNTSDFVIDYTTTIGEFKNNIVKIEDKENYTFKSFSFDMYDEVDEDDSIRIFDFLKSSNFEENKIIYYTHYTYNIPLGTYCYDDREYACKGNCEHQSYGVYKYNKLNPDFICPTCGKPVTYIGHFDPNSNGYVKTGYLNILRYTKNQYGNVGWHDRELVGNNDQKYGEIKEVLSSNTLEEANQSTSLSDGDICIDTSKYADSSNSSYKIYIYDSRRDPTYVESDIEEIVNKNDPSPETVDKFWINIANATIKPIDTSGKNKGEYEIIGFKRCFLLNDGNIVYIDRDDDINNSLYSLKLKDLFKMYKISSSVKVEYLNNGVNYITRFTVTLSGNSILDEEYSGETESKTLVFDKDVLYSNGKKLLKTEDGSDHTEFKGNYDLNNETWDGGYPDGVSETRVGSSSSTYYDGEKYKLFERYEKSIKQLTKINKLSTENDSSDNNDSNNNQNNSSSNTQIQLEDTNSLNYNGWHWIAEDTNIYYDFDAKEIDINNGITKGILLENNSMNSVSVYELLDSRSEHLILPPSRGNVRYDFYSYSLDGFTPASDTDLKGTIVQQNTNITIYRIYNIHTKINGIGLIEASAFGPDRVLFPTEYNGSGELIRYCDNPSCYTYKREVYQRKWSYHNQDAYSKNTNTLQSESNFSLDDYNFKPNSVIKTDIDLWRYNVQDQGKAVMLHRGSSGDPDIFRFDFEMKYATDEFNNRKHNIPPTINNESLPFKSYVLQKIMMRIKGTNIVPINDRPLSMYHEKYRQKLFSKFSETYREMLNNNVYNILNPYEIDIMYDILNDLPNDFKLEIMGFFNKWNRYIVYSLKEWKDTNYESYIENIQKYLNIMLNSNIIKNGNNTYYKKEILNDYFIKNDYNEYYRLLFNDVSTYKYNSKVIHVTNENFQSDNIYIRDVINYAINNFDELDFYGLDIDKDLYDFCYLTNLSNLNEPSEEDLNVEVFKGDSVTLYAKFVEKKKTEAEGLGLTESDFDSYESFVKAFYNDEEFKSLTKNALETILNSVEDGVSKEWYCLKYYNDEDNQYSIEDYENNYTDVEFNSLLDKIINLHTETIETKIGNTSLKLKDLINRLESNNSNKLENYNFLYWSMDGYYPISDDIINDESRVYKPNSNVVIYAVFERKNKISDTDYNRDWYIGESKLKEKIINTLSYFHEKLAVPVSFMTYLLGIMIWPKRFVVMTDNNGEIGSYLLSGNYVVKSDSDSKVLMHDKGSSSGNIKLDIKHTTISKRMSYVKNNDTGDILYNQYFIASNENGSTFKVYSFMTSEWLDNVNCKLIDSTLNPIFINNEYVPSKLICILPYTSKNDESLLMLIYDTGIEIFDFVKNEWKENIIFTRNIFTTQNSLIKHYTYDEYTDQIYILSNSNEIASFDMYTETVFKSDGDNGLKYVPGDETSDYVPIDNNLSSIRLLSAKLLSEDSYDESAILSVNVSNLEPYTLENDEYPWVLKSGVSETPIYPKGISDNYYNSLDDVGKSKYEIYEKLTFRYALSQSGINEDNIDKVKNIDGVSYNFERFSFYINGINITDYQLNSRLSKSIGLYAIYFKDGITIDEKYGYKMAISNYNTSGKYFSSKLEEYENSKGENDFNIIGAIDDLSFPTNIDRLYAIQGFDIPNEDYIPALALVSGTRVKFVRFRNNRFEVLACIDYEDNVPIVGIRHVDYGRKEFIIYENQRITEISTYRYSPYVLQKASDTGEKITVLGQINNIENLYIDYYTNKKEVHCVRIDNNNKDNSFYGKRLIVPNFVEQNGGDLTTYLDAKVDHTDFKFIVINGHKWKTYEAEKTDLVKIN